MVTLYVVKLDDGSFVYGKNANGYHAYYFLDANIAHYAGEGFTKACKDEYNIDVTYEVKGEQFTRSHAADLMFACAERLARVGS